MLNQNFFWVLKLPLTALGCYDTNVRLFTCLNFTWVENIELWWIMGKQKIPGWKSTLRLDKIDSWISIGYYRLTRWYQLVLLDYLTCFTITRKNKITVGWSGFVRFHQYTYASIQQFLSPLWAVIKNGEYPFLIRLNLMFTMSFWKEFQLLQMV